MLRRLCCFLAFHLLISSPAVIAGTSNSLMDVSVDGALLLVANRDNGTVSVVDAHARRALREIKVGEKPESLTWIGTGPLAAVTLYDESRVLLLNASDGTIASSIAVPAEPYGIVANRAGTRAWVSHEYPGLVSEVDLVKRKLVQSVAVGPFLRGLAIAPDERRLYATEFYTGTLAAVEITPHGLGGVVDRWPGHSQDNLCRHVVIHPKRPKAYLSHERSRVSVIDGGGSIFPQLSICDLVPPGSGKRRTSMAMDTYNQVYVVTNPWEAALSPDGRRLYTIYAGTNDMNVSRVLDDDYMEIERIGRAIQVGRNPRAVRVSPDNKTVYIYNTLDFAVSFHDAEDMSLLATVKVCSAPKSPQWLRGKILFNTSLPPMSRRRWVACASCHPDGHHDSRVWHNPEGLRKTPALFGLAHTHPLHWSADRDEVQDFEYTIRSQLMQGRGLFSGSIKPKAGFAKTELEEHLSGRSADLDALAVYTNSFDFTLSPHALAPRPGESDPMSRLSAGAQRGRKLFFSDQVGCAGCHSGPYYTDSRLQKPYNLHDVGTGNDDPSEKMGPAYDTPTILGVYRTAPYLHHGKAATLGEVLTTFNKQDRHGKTSHLKAAEIADLVEFLKSLPYEPPPRETPNTVKYRFSS
jgi:YVTN family beta-propeller protein